MDWSAFAGGTAGSIISFILLIGALLVWDQYDRRKNAEARRNKLTLSNISERQLEKQIVRDFDDLFPGWKIFNDGTKNGVRYHTGKNGAGEIDILCIDTEGNFVVIELKRKRAPDRVSSQIDRYIAWVKKNLAKPEQKVRGIIIAQTYSNRLIYTLMRKNYVSLWEYNWQLNFREVNNIPENE